MLPLPIRIALGAAAAVAVALAASASAQAAPTAVERTSATSLNYTLPGDDVGFHFVRKAG